MSASPENQKPSINIRLDRAGRKPVDDAMPQSMSPVDRAREFQFRKELQELAESLNSSNSSNNPDRTGAKVESRENKNGETETREVGPAGTSEWRKLEPLQDHDTLMPSAPGRGNLPSDPNRDKLPTLNRNDLNGRSSNNADLIGTKVESRENKNGETETREVGPAGTSEWRNVEALQDQDSLMPSAPGKGNMPSKEKRRHDHLQIENVDRGTGPPRLATAEEQRQYIHLQIKNIDRETDPPRLATTAEMKPFLKGDDLPTENLDVALSKRSTAEEKTVSKATLPKEDKSLGLATSEKSSPMSASGPKGMKVAAEGNPSAQPEPAPKPLKLNVAVAEVRMPQATPGGPSTSMNRRV
jgi:hypothetical protein